MMEKNMKFCCVYVVHAKCQKMYFQMCGYKNGLF